MHSAYAQSIEEVKVINRFMRECRMQMQIQYVGYVLYRALVTSTALGGGGGVDGDNYRMAGNFRVV